MKLELTTALALSLCSAVALSQQPQVLGDLASKQPAKLSRDDLQKLLPGASMSRTTGGGSTQFWTNEASGTFIISTDGGSTPGRRQRGSGQGTWRIDDQGRYCVVLNWAAAKEDWCRVVIRTSDGYYLALAGKRKTEKILKIDIGKK
jgi:hypothetical protein